ncbi:telomere-associated protein RIF1 [Colossoma macropomum]|uniref:telomere-associated protein RIF1 n=1 Tax=Colossoma macropomum TaxID=42526 RepID=UPI0018652A86|nr:telomere-associated protein RIF1 [Colossoma macropomum]
MMATVPLSSSSLLPLLESLEDNAAGASEQTDAYLTIANRLSGEDGRQFFPIVVKHFSRLGKALQTHISSENEELSQAALQALGFCVFNTNIVTGIPANFAEEILSALCALVLKSTDKNTCTRALWVISKQNFPAEVVSKKTSEILRTLDAMQTKDIQSILMDHESLNVVIKLLEQAPTQMGEGAVCWAKLVIPLVVHSASKVRLRAAAALEMGLPLLLEKQQEVAAIVEPMMSSKLIPEMQKLFSTKNESNVLKLWPLFVKLLGKLLHKGGAFINSLLYLEELGFRSSSPSIKKIAFIAWKSLIDNFALNPDILCSSKRLKLLMQPLSSILVRTEALLLTKLEVWWYLVVKLGPNLASNFDQVGVPLLHSTLSPDASVLQCPTTPARGTSQSNGIGLATPKSGVPSCSSPGATSRSLNSSMSVPQSYTSIQLLGLEMLLHYFLGSQATAAATKNKLQLSLEPLTHNLLSSQSFFSKHSSTFISAVKTGFIAVGKDAPEALLSLIWNSLVNLVSATIETAGNKKERQGSEVLTLLLQALQSILTSEALPAPRGLALLEATVKGIPQKVLGSAAYQVANMDVLNGTPALFLILLFYNNNLLSSFVADERFFLCLETLVSCGLCGPTSPLAFVEAVLGTVSRNVEAVENKEHLWRMWSVVVNPLTDTITQTNEVNQGDALEHNFSAIHSALMFPITHLLPGSALPQMTQKTMLSTWSRLYKAFARCSALVATAEENVCCEELCARISATLEAQALKNLSTLDAIANILLSVIESVDFSPFTARFQQKMKSPHTPLGWVRKRSKALGNLSNFHVLLVQSLEAFLALNSSDESSVVLSGIGVMLVSIVSTLFTNLSLPNVIQESLATLTKPLALLYGQVGSSEGEPSKSHSVLGSKLEKLVGEMLGCLQTRSALQYDDELLAVLSPLLCVLFPHTSKHIRSAVTQFWNATFGNALVLTYPEMLTPVLSQAKQKAPLILPGFQAVENAEDFSGQCSSECSQLDAEISGMKMSSAGKRESLLAKAAELKEKSSGTSKPVSVKLDFGSPKPPRREVLEEEASVDFVFIPPEPKERVLTEHQKEVKRTKRDDIPAMYNNLDASLDATVFTQYTQSQEESMDILPADEQPKTTDTNKIETMDLEREELPAGDAKEAQEEICSETDVPEKVTNDANQATEMPTPVDISVADVSGPEDSAKIDQSPNVSGSSDMISGTPPKPSSRRQSFITLEKYAEGKPASPLSVTKFTGPLTRTSCSQDTKKTQQSTPNATYCSQPETDKKDAQDSSRMIAQQSTPQTEEKKLEIMAEVKSVVKCSSEGTEDEDDVIPDTQTQGLNGSVDSDQSLDKSNVEVEPEKASLEGNSEVPAQSSSHTEPRRSGRRRSRPVRPGEDSVDQESKNKLQKTDSVNESALTDAQKPTFTKQTDSILPGRSRRSKVLEENKGESSRSQFGELKEHSLTDSQVSPSTTSNSSQGRSSRSKNKELSQTESPNKQSPLSQTDNTRDSDSLSHSRPVRRTRVSVVSPEGSGKKQNEEGSQSDSQAGISILKNKHADTLVSDTGADSQSTGRPRRTRRSEATDAQNKDKPVIENEPVSDLSHSDSQTLTPAKGRLGRRRRAEEEINASKDTPPSDAINSESSQAEAMRETQDSQGRGKYNTRRSSQGSLAPLETSESDSSDNREGQRSKKARGQRSLASEVMPDNMTHENVSESKMDKENADPIEMSEKEPKACLDVSMPCEAKAEDKEEVSTAKEPVIEHCISETKSTEQKSDELKMEVDTIKEMGAVLELKPLEDGTVASLQNSLVLPEKVVLKTPELHRCPHIKKIRGRKRSTSCNCLLASSSSMPSQENVSSDSQVCQNMKDKVPLELNSLPSESELSNIKPVFMEKHSETSPDSCPVVANDERSTVLLNSTDTGVPTESPEKELSATGTQLSDMKEGLTQAKEDQNADDAESKHQGKEQNSSTSENVLDREQLQSSSTQGTSQNHSGSMGDKIECPEQSEAPVSQNNAIDLSVNEDGEKLEMPEKEDVHGTDGDGVTPLPEGTELDDAPRLKGDSEDTQIDDKDIQPETDLPSEECVPLQMVSTETCLDSPPKQKTSDVRHGDQEVGQSPSSSGTRGVWSPSASPSTSILKKGQKRQFEEDSPSPLLKSRRVSFANPIYQQELADDIDRRSPVIRTSSPRSKTVGQPKYITTPTKGLLTLSPRNLRSPGYKSSKKCLISEMSQEPRPIPKDCVYPALVCCSTPVEAVLPQISSHMWPRGLGQLVRARNIKTVGDLSALTPSEIKLLPIRSPKLSNVKKALKNYHEQQRKGRSDDLKGFDEMEKMTSEPEEMDAAPNQEEEQTSTVATDASDAQEVVSSEVASASEVSSDLLSASEQKQEAPVSVELLSDVSALGARLTTEELSRCSPRELGLMHEQLSGMMRSIVDHLQSRLVKNLEDSLL